MKANVLEWVERTTIDMPEKIAIQDQHEKLTFKEYHDKSIGMAEAIIEMGYGTRRPIAIYLEKSLKVLVSFMAVAYSGNFYSPIDTEMPAVRVNRILEVLEPGLVITTRSMAEELKAFGYGGAYLFYEEVAPLEESEKVQNVLHSIIDTDLLYVLFTSGSTGVPKGVCISHGSVIDYIDWVTETFSVTASDAFGNQAPFYFDNSILDIYSTLKTGATLYIIPQKLFSQPVPLLEYIKANKINTIFWVPSALIVVSKLRAFRNVDLTGVLERVLFCGEAMPNKQLNVWRKYLPNVTYANLYGPTEITDACTCYIVDREFEDDEPLPIGYPMKNTDVLVLDDMNCLVTREGVVGELCVRGTGLARGYYRNPEKTKSVFVQNPLNDAYEEKIYRTGDLVKYNQQHELVYLSRKDFQIKHMGHRIELGEIETAASSIQGISLCCCLYDEKHSRIVLFIDKEMRKEEINKQLKVMLPEYMLPGKVVVVEKMPINANGKIDRVQLKECL